MAPMGPSLFTPRGAFGARRGTGGVARWAMLKMECGLTKSIVLYDNHLKKEVRLSTDQICLALPVSLQLRSKVIGIQKR